MNPAFDVPAIAHVAFWIVSAMVVGAALMVILVSDIFKAALFLAVSFLGAAGLYFLMQAEFIGVAQVLIYVGAVSILIVFAIMLVRDMEHANRDNPHMVMAAAVAAALFVAVVAFVGYNTPWNHVDDLTDDDAIAVLAGQYVETEVVVDGVPAAALVAAPGQPGAEPGMLVDSTGYIGALIVGDFLLPFEALGVLLVAALIGALVLARERPAE